MPTDDDDAAGHHGGGPLSYVLKWLWRYRLMIAGLEFRSLWFFVGLTLLAFVVGKVV